MRVVVLAAGSRGDVQPYLAFALALRDAGYDVRFAANPNFASWAEEYGLPFRPIGPDSRAFVRDPRVQDWLSSPNPLRLAWTTWRVVRPVLGRVFQDARAASGDADAIVYHTLTVPAGLYLARERGVPALPVSMYPPPTRAHPALPWRYTFPRSAAFNLLSHRVLRTFTWLTHRSAVGGGNGGPRIPLANPERELGTEAVPLVCCYSREIMPLSEDHSPHVHVTGTWTLPPPPGWSPAPDLVRFLESGDPPVLIGFGSMGDPRRAGETTRLVIEALGRTGRRGILVSGWGGLDREGNLPAGIHAATALRYDWVLPRCAAFVHHGGVGTTGSGLRAGIPNLVVPHFSDQHFWGRRVCELGAGPAPIPRSRLTVGRLAEGIERAVMDEAIGRTAAALGGRMRREPGTARGVEVFAEVLAVGAGPGLPAELGRPAGNLQGTGDPGSGSPAQNP